jgi:hypothetical protein
MTETEKQKLIKALTNKGYSWINAYNVAYGDMTIARQRYQEYCTNPIDDFFNKWNNRGSNYDKVFGNQCVDVFKYFNRDVVGATEVSGNAINYWTKYPTHFYTKIINTPWFIPKKGDVMIWAVSKTLPLGHIAIVKEANLFSFVSFEQNWPTQGYYDKKGNFIGTGVCHFEKHNYLFPKVLGVLRPNKLP